MAPSRLGRVSAAYRFEGLPSATWARCRCSLCQSISSSIPEHEKALTAEECIYQAGIMRFRPILMTTMAALFGGFLWMLGRGVGSALPQPFGYVIVGAGHSRSQWDFLNHNLVVHEN